MTIINTSTSDLTIHDFLVGITSFRIHYQIGKPTAYLELLLSFLVAIAKVGMKERSQVPMHM